MLALCALFVTATSMLAVLAAAARTRREVDPTLRALSRLRGDLAPALLVVRSDRDRAGRLRERR
jgi:hypothetical protein